MSKVNRIVAVILIFLAIGLHFAFCEWYFPDELRDVGQSYYERTIYFRGSHSYRKKMFFADNVFLLAKPTSDRDEALLWGVIIPGGMIGGSLLVFKAWKQGQEPSI
jgi:hypothetical protein